tara:strand:+ start:1712 stop:2731 length:1020 start_codon:yes stop_codon:yes gene_type:complete
MIKMVQNLSGKTSNGTLCFAKYVTNKNNWRNNVYKTIKECNVTDSSGNNRFNIGANVDIYFVSDKTIQIKNYKYCAQIKENDRTGYIPLNNIAKPCYKDVMKSEKKCLEDLQKLFENGPINIITPEDGAIYMNCYKAEKVNEKNWGRDVKADYVIEDTNGNKVIYISHKKGKTAKDFQQFGGVSSKSGSKSDKNCICDHSEVKDFLKKAIKHHNGKKIKYAIYGFLFDKNLVGKSVFGPDYSVTNPNFGPEFCQLVVQGKPSLKKSNIENCYEINWTGNSHCWNNVQFFTESNNNYRAVIGITYRSGRSFQCDNKKYEGSRVGIYALEFITNRNGCMKI